MTFMHGLQLAAVRCIRCWTPIRFFRGSDVATPAVVADTDGLSEKLI